MLWGLILILVHVILKSGSWDLRVWLILVDVNLRRGRSFDLELYFVILEPVELWELGFNPHPYR